MKIEKNMEPRINTVLQETIFKTEFDNFQAAYAQAQAQKNTQEMKRLYELAKSVTSREVRFGPAFRINPYLEDLFDKAEYKEILTELEQAQKSGDSSHIKALNETAMRLAGKSPDSSRVNPYFKDMVDKSQYDHLMKQVERSNKTQDKELAKTVAKQLEAVRQTNSYVKDHIDKLQFDRITTQLEAAKKSGKTEVVEKLTKELYEVSGRDPNSNVINPYVKDDLDKKEFESFQKSLALAQKKGDRESQKILLERAKGISGINDSKGRINPYIRQYFDEIEAQRYMDERNQAKKSGDKSNYDRVTELMKQAAGNIGFITFQYSPTLDFQQAQEGHYQEQSETKTSPNQETSKDSEGHDILDSAIEATELSTTTGSINQQVQNMKDIQRAKTEPNIDIARD